jgi:uncharacterized protein
MVTLRIFGFSLLVTVVSLAVGFWYAGLTGLFLVVVLSILEVSLSFDNAVLNATILQRMSPFWQRIFLTVGILIAVFGMRLIFPLLIVWATAGLNPAAAMELALGPPTDGSPTYEQLITAAHPQIAAFGGVFLLMLFLDFIFGDRDIKWLRWLEVPLARIGQLGQLSVVVSCIALAVVAGTLTHSGHERSTVLLAGLLGLITYLVVNGLGRLFHPPGADAAAGPSELAQAAGKAGFMLFLYLEVLDATFSFDGVIGAFAITSDPIIIALGLGLVGAMFVRSITVYLVRRGTLGRYVYLEHGAHWAIGALAVILLISIGYHVPEVVTGLVGMVLIGAAYVSSVVRNRRRAETSQDLVTVG